MKKKNDDINAAVLDEIKLPDGYYWDFNLEEKAIETNTLSINTYFSKFIHIFSNRLFLASLVGFIELILSDEYLNSGLSNRYYHEKN